MSYAIAGGCPECYLDSGGQCVPCEAGMEHLPECDGCVGLTRKSVRSFLEHPLWGPVIVGIVGTITTGVAMYAIKRYQLLPKEITKAVTKNRHPRPNATTDRGEREKAKRFWDGLDNQSRGAIGDQLVLGTFDWRDWGFERKPTRSFLTWLDYYRTLWEMEHSG